MSEEKLHTVYLSLGSNIGDRRATMLRAVKMIDNEIGEVDRQSDFIETEPWGFHSSNKFINMCVRVLTGQTPEQLLAGTQNIERKLGRTSKSTDGQYHDRPIDIDILMYDNLKMSTPNLILPHPHMHERDFVMIPLRQIL